MTFTYELDIDRVATLFDLSINMCTSVRDNDNY